MRAWRHFPRDGQREDWVIRLTVKFSEQSRKYLITSAFVVLSVLSAIS